MRHARNRQRVLAGKLSALDLAAGLTRLPLTSAIASDSGQMPRRDADRFGVRVGQNVIFLGASP
jgi:hypothetical protein